MKENYKDIIASLKEIPYQDIVKSVLNSSLVIYDQKDKSYYALDLNNVPTRNVSESSVDITISGPKDSLIESIDKNLLSGISYMRSTALNIITNVK